MLGRPSTIVKDAAVVVVVVAGTAVVVTGTAGDVAALVVENISGFLHPTSFGPRHSSTKPPVQHCDAPPGL